MSPVPTSRGTGRRNCCPRTARCCRCWTRSRCCCGPSRHRCCANCRRCCAPRCRCCRCCWVEPLRTLLLLLLLLRVEPLRTLLLLLLLLRVEPLRTLLLLLLRPELLRPRVAEPLPRLRSLPDRVRVSPLERSVLPPSRVRVSLPLVSPRLRVSPLRVRVSPLRVRVSPPERALSRLESPPLLRPPGRTCSDRRAASSRLRPVFQMRVPFCRGSTGRMVRPSAWPPRVRVPLSLDAGGGAAADGAGPAAGRPARRWARAPAGCANRRQCGASGASRCPGRPAGSGRRGSAGRPCHVRAARRRSPAGPGARASRPARPGARRRGLPW